MMTPTGLLSIKPIAAFHAFRGRAGVLQKLLLALGWAGATGLAAQIVIPLPGTPVPITGQTFAVLLSGVILGRRWGAMSQALYVGLGAAGLPWFARAGFGTAVLLGPTGGYLAGFVLASWFLGHVIHRRGAPRGFLPLVVLMACANFLFIYLPGLAGLALWRGMTAGEFPSLGMLLATGLLPFVAGDLIKIIAAASAARAIGPGPR